MRLDVRLGCHSLESPFLLVTFAVVKDLTEYVIPKDCSDYRPISVTPGVMECHTGHGKTRSPSVSISGSACSAL